MNAHAATSFACRAVCLLLAGGCAREGLRTSAAGPTPASVEARGTRFSPWTPETFARAEREKKPLLVHVAAVWCHWCHVMEEETYGDPAVAALLAERFVAVRVDSDARPDVAERYAAWGWPATALLTPDARPIVALRGFQERGPFLELLRRVADDVAIGRERAEPRPAPPKSPVDPDLARTRDAVRAQLDGLFDARLGGFGSFQKYPLGPPVEELLRRATLDGDAAAGERAAASLRGYLRLEDPEFGGLYQYSVPRTWDAPHYEKLAFVQAAAIRVFALAAATDPARLAPARRTRDYVRRFLRRGDGAFFATQDADLRAHDGPDGPAVLGAAYYALPAAARSRLGVPRIDASVYADVNGRLIDALLALYARTGDAADLADAERATDAVFAELRTADGAFRHGARDDGSTLHLADQTAVGAASLALYEATGDPRRLAASLECARFVRAALEDPVAGGFFAHTPDPAARGVFAERRKPLALNADAARWFLRLAAHVDDPSFAASADRALRAFADPALYAAEGREVGEYLLALEERLRPGPRLALVLPDASEASRTFLAAVLALDLPGRTLLRPGPDGTDDPSLGVPALYVCFDGFCSAPLTDVATLADDVRRAAR